jgi:hypothetical protein
VAQRAQVPAILALMILTSIHSREQFVSRHFNAAIDITRYAVLKETHEELTRSNLFGWPSMLEAFLDELQPKAGGQ